MRQSRSLTADAPPASTLVLASARCPRQSASATNIPADMNNLSKVPSSENQSLAIIDLSPAIN